MKGALKFVIALIVTILLMLAFRALMFTVYTVRGTALEPCFIDGDRILVNRWSYGLRTGDGHLFRYTRWFGSPVERGDLAVIDNPQAVRQHSAWGDMSALYCTAVPGDTVTIAGMRVTVPGRQHPVEVTTSNMRLLSFIYNNYEGRKATVSGGRLTVDGVETRCAMFANDYYWFSAGHAGAAADSRYFGFVPEDHVIGKVTLLLYSVDSELQLKFRLRPDRWMLVIRKGGGTSAGL